LIFSLDLILFFREFYYKYRNLKGQMLPPKYIKWRKGQEYVTLYEYKTADGYKGSVVQLKKIHDLQNPEKKQWR